MRKVLVTGATGFIGSHLTRRLIERGDSVQAWTASDTRLWRLKGLEEKLDLKKVDIRDFAQVKAACAELNPDVAFHLAAYGVNYDEQESGAAVDVNVRGTVHLLEGLKETGCKRIVATGTWAEYGIKDHPVREDEPLDPVGVYGTSKAAATTIALKMAAQDNLPLVVLRPFSVYGPGEGEYKFVPTVIRSFLKKEAPKLTACSQVRDYIFVEDVVDAYLKAAEAEIKTPVVLNIASGEPIQLKQLVTAVMGHFPGLQADFGVFPERKNEIRSVQADVTRARQLLGWRASVPLEKGIGKTIDWYRNRNGNS